jgi:hypothetical protein
MSEIKEPCPFCGSRETDLVGKWNSGDDTMAVYVVCLKCKARGPMKDFYRGSTEFNDRCIDASVDLWNKRS